jgi:acyl-CoA thioesterase-1
MTINQPLILAIGDSLIAGYGLQAADSFPAQLQASLQKTSPYARVANAGVSGDTTVDQRPVLAIVQVGPNDVLRQVPVARTRAQLEQILLNLGSCGIPVLLTTVDPPVFIRDRAVAYLDIHTALAAEYGATICPFFPPGVLEHADMVLADQVHPNAKAIAAVVAAILPTVEKML